MRTSLWENRHVRMLRLDGTITNVRLAFQEPEGVDDYWQVGRHGPGRGTMHGNPSFLDRRDMFHASAHYESILLASPDGTAEYVTDVVAVRRFQRHLNEGTACAIYFVSPKGATAGKNLVFAVRTADEQEHDIDGVCTLAGDLEEGLARQLRMITIPVGLSLIVTFIVGISLLEPILGMRGVITATLLLAAFFVAALLAGRAVLRARLRQFPSKRVFERALRMDGWHLP